MHLPKSSLATSAIFLSCLAPSALAKDPINLETRISTHPTHPDAILSPEEAIASQNPNPFNFLNETAIVPHLPHFHNDLSFSARDLIGQNPQQESDRTNPDGNFLQPIDPALPREDPNLFPDIDETTPANPDRDGLSFPLNRIDVRGSTVFTPEDLSPIIDPLQGQNVTLGQLQEAADAITQLYVREGYINSRAVLKKQTIGNGIAIVEIVEGTISDIQIDGLDRFKPFYFISRLNRGIDTPFNVNNLEDALRLLQGNPLIEDFDINLQPGENIGENTLLLTIQEASPFFGVAFADNYSAASVGSERYGLNAGYRNLLGVGDIFHATVVRSTTGGSRIYDLNYRIPFNAMEGTVDFAISLDRNDITQSPFRELGFRGESETYAISVRQPLIRTFTDEFALSLGLRHKTGQTFLFDDVGTPFSSGAEEDGTTRTMVLSFGQDYLKRDGTGAWVFRSQLNFGLDWWDATRNNDPIPDGRFFSWTGQMQRLQQLGKNHLLILQGDVQLSPNNLLASERFSIGGGQTLRGYRQGARSGDNGWRVSLEDRITLVEEQEAIHLLQVIPFFDMGMVWNNPSNPDQIDNEHFLAGVGVGFLYSPVERLTMRLDLTLPLVQISDRSVNAQDDGVYFSLAYNF